MTTHTLAQGTRSSSLLSMGTLAAGTYVATSSGIDLGAAIPLDRTFEIVATPGSAPSGNKKLDVFAKLSLDNSNWTSGPESGTTTTNEPDLHMLGSLPLNDTSAHSKMFSLAGLPIARYLKIIVKNDAGVALASGEVYAADISGSST